MHATTRIRGVKLGIDLASGLRLQRAFQSSGLANRLAALELSYKTLPVSLTSEWGRKDGRFANERLGVVYRLRY